MTTSRLAQESIAASQAIQNVSLVQRLENYLNNNDQSQFLYIVECWSYYTDQQIAQSDPELRKAIDEIDERKLDSPQKCMLKAFGYENGININALKAIELYKLAIRQYEVQLQQGKLTTAAAQQGIDLANTMIGHLYHSRKNFTLARDALDLATRSEPPHPYAMLVSSKFYKDPENPFRDEQKAAACRDKGAEQQQPACLLRKGVNSQLQEEEMQCLSTASRLGNLSAIALLGHKIMETDSKSAWACLDFTAAAGNVDGLFFSGEHLAAGDGREKNLGTAATFYRRAYLLGDYESYYRFHELVGPHYDRGVVLNVEYQIRQRFESALVYFLPGTMSYLANRYPEIFYEFVASVPWQEIYPLLDAKTTEAVLERIAKLKTSQFVSMVENLPEGTDAAFPKGLLRLILENLFSQSFVPPKNKVQKGDPVLQQFIETNKTPMLKRAEDFLQGSKTAIYYLVDEGFYDPARLAEEAPRLGEMISRLPEDKNDKHHILQGLRFEKGWGIAPDLKQAEVHYKAAAEKTPLGNTLLGLLYLHKLKNADKAREYLKLAADLDEPIAMHELSQLLDNKSEAAISYAHLAAKALYPPALYRRAQDTILTGKREHWGRVRNDLMQAATRGWPNALNQLGVTYCLGYQVMPRRIYEVDHHDIANVMHFEARQPRGVAYLQALAECCPSRADVYYNLGRVYDSSLGIAVMELEKIETNDKLAVEYYLKARMLGDDRLIKDAQTKLFKILQEKMGPAEQKQGFFEKLMGKASYKEITNRDDFEICYKIASALGLRPHLEELGKDKYHKYRAAPLKPLAPTDAKKDELVAFVKNIQAHFSAPSNQQGLLLFEHKSQGPWDVLMGEINKENIREKIITQLNSHLSDEKFKQFLGVDKPITSADLPDIIARVNARVRLER